MTKSKNLFSALDNCDRRTFLKACGALGVGAVAGGLLQGAFNVVKLGGGLESVSLSRVAMGTFVSITAVHASRDLAQEAIGRAFEEVDRLVPLLSRHDSASPVFALNRDGVLGDPPREMMAVVKESLAYNKATGGLFDITVKPVIDLLESKRGEHFVRPSDSEIAAALSRIGIRNLQLTSGGLRLLEPGMGITLDGIAMGYIIDRASEVLSARGITDHLVNGGGDIRTRGRNAEGQAWTIAVEDPRKKGHYPQALRLTDAAVATSGNYEIFYGQQGVFCHIVDPRNGLSPVQSVSSTIVADSVLRADALSTAAFIGNPAAAIAMIGAMPRTEAFLVGGDGGRFATKGWRGADC